MRTLTLSMPEQTTSTAEKNATRAALALFFQMGYLIALPAVAFGFGGAYADKALGTSPLLTIIGLSLALTSSMMLVWKILKKTLPPGNPGS